MNQDLCIELIQLYGTFKCLWDPRDPDYVNKTKRQNCWKQISAELKFPVLDLKKKMENLMGSYRREKSRERKSSIRRAVKGSKHVYISKWFGYKYFDFMATKNDPGPIEDKTENEVKKNAWENIKQESDVNVEQDLVEKIAQGSEKNIEKNSDESIEKDRVKNVELDPIKNVGHLKKNIKQEPVKNIESVATNSSLHCPKQTLKFRRIKPATKQPSPKKRRILSGSTEKKSEPFADAMITQVFEMLQRSVPSATDSYYSFGLHIANELRKYDQHTLACVKNAINHTIYEADMGLYTKPDFPASASERPNSSHTFSDSHLSLPPNPSSHAPRINSVYIKQEKNVD